VSTIALVFSFVLAAVCLLSGANKFSGSELARTTPEHLDIDPGRYRLAGVFELIGAVGLVLAALGVVADWLGAAAAFGMCLLMAFAIAFHLRAGDPFAPKGSDSPGWAPAGFVLLLAAVTGILILA